MTFEQVLPKFSRTQLTTSIAMMILLAIGSFAQQAPRSTPRAMRFQQEKAMSIEPVGAGAAAFKQQQARPAAMVSADFDSDGVKDLAVGYGLNKGDEIAIFHGNLDAIAPQSKESWLNSGIGRYADAFLPQANMIPVPVEPDLLIAMDVNGDGYIDLVMAAKNGNALYVLAGNGKGQFTLLQLAMVPGTITALAAYKPGDNNSADALIVGVKTGKGYAAELYRMEHGDFALRAAYAMPGAVSAIATANLDSDLTPDAALIAGGQVVVLHGADALAGSARLENLPISEAVSLTVGSFLFDRHAGMQLVVLTSDGTVHFLAHQGFDPRPFTVQEIGAARRNAMRHEHSPTLAQIAGNTGNAPWTEVETIGGVAPAALDGTVPVLLRAHATGSGQDDLLALNGAQQEIAVVRHPASANSAFAAASGVVTRSPLSSGGVIAAIAQRASPQGADGIITLKEGSIHPEITTPAQSNTMYVNTTADSLDANNANRCTQSDTTDTCSLRDAITYANADASVNIGGGTSDTIMIPAGTYNLTYQASQVDANNNAVTHLEILGPMTLVGDPGGVTINGQSNDVIFSINPGPYGSYNPSGDSYVFDTTFENLNITGGQNNDNPANSGTGLPNNVGGGINWDANGTGNLTLTSCTVDSNTNGWGDGGGIWFFNSAGGGSGTLTINGGSVSSNQTSEEGGGIYQATAPAGFAATNVTFSSNTASPTVNTSDPGGAAGADYGGGLFFSAIPSGSGIPQSTIVGGSITSNFADGDGGGIYTTQGISITGGTSISSNSATGSGGGIFHDADATTTVTAANITSNSATHTGGGITVGTETAANGNAFTIANSRIFGNTSTNGVNGLSAGEPSSSGAGAVTATENWWGCNAGPVTSADGCDQATLYDPSTGSMSVTPNIVLTLGVSPDPVNEGSALQLDAAVNTNSSSGTVPGGPGALQGLTVDFAATVGAFSASPTATIDGTGNATTSVTPTSSGAGTATATLDNQTVTQSFSVASGAPTITSANAASFTSGTVGAFTVTTTGTPTPALSETGALPSGVTFVDNGNGTATISGTAGLATTYTITITAANGVSPNATQSFTLTVNPGAATHLVIPGGPAPFYTAFDINIYAYDAAGNLATSYNGTVALTSSDPGFVNLGPFTLANGQTVATAVLKTAGVDTITATDVSNASITGTGSFTVQPGAATHFGLSAPTAAYAGSPINFTVTAYDLYGNVATSYSGTVHFTSTDASAVLPADSTLTNGVGTFSATLMTVGSQTISATDTITSSITGMSGSIAVTIPNYVVTTATDDAGAASNCTVQTTPGSGTDATCSLRDALLAAGNAGSGSITFDSTKFASATSITLTNGTLNVPSNTSVTGPTTGSAATLTYLVTVSGNNAYTVFTVNAGVAGAAISNLVVTNGNTQFGGGGILNQGTLLVTGSAISGNTAIAPNGGGIYNASTGTLTLTNSTISGNTLQSGGIGDGIYNNGGTLTLTNSTVSGNNLPNGNGAGILSNNDGTLTLTNSTISGNSGAGGIGGGIYSVNSTVTITNTTISGNTASEAGGIFFAGTGSITLANTIVAGDTATTDPDFEGAATDGGYNLIGNGSGLTGITNGTNGDQVGTSASPLNPLLAALANYGGPTQTMLPLLGSPAICAINPSSATGTDQRGLPRTTTYGPTTCQDAGAVETNYALSFTTNPAATETNGVSFPAAVTLTESANPISGISIPVTLNGGGTLAGSPVSATTGATGVATYTLTVSNPTALSNLTLAATLPAPPSITTTSSDFDLTEPAPTVTTISPTSGPSAGGIIVTITGTNFTGATAVEFGSTSATSYTVVSPNQITATSPAGTGTVDITVSTPGGTSVKSTADQFTYRPPPAVTSISPKSGPPAGGTTVTISGTNFVTGDTVSFGLVTAIVPVTLTATQISVVSPPGTGTVDVTVVDPNGISSATSAADKFTYLAVSVTAMPISATAGTAFSGQVATFNENTGNLDSVSAFTSTISWGDGTVPSVGTIIQPGGVGTPYAVTGTHTYASGGSYSFNVTVTPVAGNSVSGNSTATVSQAPAITSASGTTYILGTLGSFLVTTTGFPTPSLSETGALPGGLVFVDNGNGTATLAGTPSAGGIYPITIRAANGVGTNATQSFTLTVIYPVAVTANAISPVAEAPFSSVVGSFISANNRVSLVTFSATVDWGDGTISTAIITQPGGAGTAYLVTGTHTYVASGIFNFIVTVTPAVGPAATGTNTATVAPAPATHFMITAPASASVGGPFNVSVTAFDALNNPTIGYYGTVHFTSTDPSAVLPADATLTNGVGTFSATLMIVGNQTITATDTVASSITGTTGAIAVTIPSFVVTNTDDSGAGSLRAALASAASAGSGNITFDPSEFATAQTIMLTSGTLNIPSNTTITGPTTGNGATLTNLVTVSSGGVYTIFTVASGVTGSAVANLNIANGGGVGPNGGGITNAGTLTVSGSTFSNNLGNSGGIVNSGTLTVTRSAFSNNDGGSNGGGIANTGTLTVTGSTFSGNNAAFGAGIYTTGTLTVSDSTVANNAAQFGGGIYINGGTATVTGSTVSKNSATPGDGGGIEEWSGSLALANTILDGNGLGGQSDDLDSLGASYPFPTPIGSVSDCNGASLCNVGGNIVGYFNTHSVSNPSSVNLAPLGNYGGPMQTMIPLPGSTAICAGLSSNIPPGVTTDQRGDPNTNTTYSGYDSSAPCVDSGSVQTNYSLTFSADPPASVIAATNFNAGVTLFESGSPFIVTATPLPTINIPLTLNGTGTLTGGSAAIDDATGIATYSGLQVDQVGNDMLTANLTLNPNTTPTALAISATSSSFNVGHAATTTTASNATATYSTTAQSVLLSVIVTSNAGTVNAGTVAFTVLQGATLVGSAATTGPVTNGSASVSYTLPAGTAAGTYTIQAVYSGTASFATSSDSTHTLIIGMATATVTLGNLTQTYTGSPLPVTATTAPPGLTVNITYNGSVSPPTIVGSYPVAATIASSNYTGSATGTLTITQAATSTSLIASATSITPGEPLTLTATVISATAGTPTGTVTFYDNIIPLGTVQLNGGGASFMTSALAPSIAHKISATYSGDMNFIPSSTTAGLTVTVTALEFSLTINGNTFESVYPGGTVTYSFSVAPQFGFYAGPMSFAISGLPSGVTATFSPDSIPANGGPQTVKLTISDAALASAASPPTGLPKHIMPIALGLLLLPLAGAGRMRRNGRKMRQMFYVMVLACSALSATLLSGCGSANGFFAQAPKNYNLTITATAGNIQKSATVTLDVQ